MILQLLTVGAHEDECRPKGTNSTFTRSEFNIFLHQFLERTQQLCRDAAVLTKRKKNGLVDSSNLTVEFSAFSTVTQIRSLLLRLAFCLWVLPQ